MKGEALGLASKGMEVEAGDIEVAQRRSPFQRIQSSERAVLKVCRDSSTSVFAKQLFKPIVTETPYHCGSVT